MEPEAITEILEMIGSIGAPAAAVIIGMKYAINGMREDVKEIKGDVKSIKGTVQKHAVDIARLQTRNEVVDG